MRSMKRTDASKRPNRPKNTAFPEETHQWLTGEGEMARRMREACAVGYLTKSGPAAGLIDAIRKCMVSQESQHGPMKSQVAAN
jgi:hypothetical protein